MSDDSVHVTAIEDDDDAISAPPADGEQVVTPWTVQAGVNGIDYTRLVHDFGSELITDSLVSRIEGLTKKRAHPWLRRQLFFSHRDMEPILDTYAKGLPFYLYTGRGPSSDALHLGHLIPFMFTKVGLSRAPSLPPSVPPCR